MTTLTVELPDEAERGIRVTCATHDSTEEFQPGFRRVAFHCEQCGHELELTLHDLLEWRDLGERC